MEAGFMDAGQGPSARLRLVRLYLPRVLMATAQDSDAWVFASALHQLGEQVLSARGLYQLRLVPDPNELVRCQQELTRLGKRLLARNRLQASLLNEWQQTADWRYVQTHLRRAMPLIERLLGSVENN